MYLLIFVWLKLDITFSLCLLNSISERIFCYTLFKHPPPPFLLSVCCEEKKNCVS